MVGLLYVQTRCHAQTPTNSNDSDDALHHFLSPATKNHRKYVCLSGCHLCHGALNYLDFLVSLLACIATKFEGSVMANQLAFAIITPHTIRKSRTGSVLARLLSRTSAELVTTQMLAPSKAFAETYAASIPVSANPTEEFHRQLIRDYIKINLSPDADGRRHRALMLVFKGENAFENIREVVGKLPLSGTSGETIRDTYGDLVCNTDGSVQYFEPAVLTSTSQDTVASELKLWVDFAEQQPTILENICVYDAPAEVEKSLVIIKPDNWRCHTLRPGAIIDIFSRTGLRIIGSKVCHISVAQALEFYGQVEEVLCNKLAPSIGRKAREILNQELDIELPAEAEAALAKTVGIPYAKTQFENIIEFMTGLRPSQCPEKEYAHCGKVKCLVLIYEGQNAIRKIRDVLGPTDPSKAPSGTVRREFGSNITVNSAHASDSPASAQREMGILCMEKGNFVPIIKQALEKNTDA